MAVETPGSGQPPSSQPPPPPQDPPAPTPNPLVGLEALTSAQIKDLYAKSPELFKEVVPAAPPKDPPPASPTPSAPDEVKLSLPDGANVDPKVLDRFKERWLKTSPEKRAQAVVDFYLELNKEAHESNRASFEGWRKKNVEVLQADPEFKDFEAAKAIAQKPLAKYGSPELAKALADSGWENHPELARFLHKIGKAMGEDSTVRPPPRSVEVSDEEKSLRQRYPSMYRDQPADT